MDILVWIFSFAEELVDIDKNTSHFKLRYILAWILMGSIFLIALLAVSGVFYIVSTESFTHPLGFAVGVLLVIGSIVLFLKAKQWGSHLLSL